MNLLCCLMNIEKQKIIQCFCTDNGIDMTKTAQILEIVTQLTAGIASFDKTSIDTHCAQRLKMMNAIL